MVSRKILVRPSIESRLLPVGRGGLSLDVRGNLFLVRLSVISRYITTAEGGSKPNCSSSIPVGLHRTNMQYIWWKFGQMPSSYYNLAGYFDWDAILIGMPSSYYNLAGCLFWLGRLCCGCRRKTPAPRVLATTRQALVWCGGPCTTREALPRSHQKVPPKGQSEL